MCNDSPALTAVMHKPASICSEQSSDQMAWISCDRVLERDQFLCTSRLQNTIVMNAEQLTVCYFSSYRSPIL